MDGPSLPLNPLSLLSAERFRACRNIHGWDPPYFQQTITAPPTTSPNPRLWKTQPYGGHRLAGTTASRGPRLSEPIRARPSSVVEDQLVRAEGREVGLLDGAALAVGHTRLLDHLDAAARLVPDDVDALVAAVVTVA